MVSNSHSRSPQKRGLDRSHPVYPACITGKAPAGCDRCAGDHEIAARAEVGVEQVRLLVHYDGHSGSTDDEANFYCRTNPQDDPALLAQEAGLLQGKGPLKGNHDIGDLEDNDDIGDLEDNHDIGDLQNDD